MHCLNSEALYCAVMAFVMYRPSFTTILSGMKKTIKKLLWQPQAGLHMLETEQELYHMLAFLFQSAQSWSAY